MFKIKIGKLLGSALSSPIGAAIVALLAQQAGQAVTDKLTKLGTPKPRA
jgi:hypothetical protein